MKKETGPLGWCPPARYKGAVSGFLPALRRLNFKGWGLIGLVLLLWLQYVPSDTKRCVVVIASMFTVVETCFTAATDGLSNFGSTPE
jgi:hypothetical protein